MKRSIKKIIALMLALLVVLPVGAIGVFAADANAPATVAEPVKYEINKDWRPNDAGVWEIRTPGDLLAFLDDSFRTEMRSVYPDAKDYAGGVVLMNDIDLNPGWDASTKTTPANVSTGIFYMRCTFDGQGHTIKGMCIIKEGGDNATVVTLAEGQTKFKNVNIVNSYFSARAVGGKGGNGAGLVSAARFSAAFENVYLDAICEATNGNAGGFVSWFNATSASCNPSVTIKNCVFAGTVIASKAAGAFVGTNDRPSNNQGKSVYTISMTDCANYGTVTSSTANMAGGLVGCLANKGVFLRCYNAGNAPAALFNVHKSTTDNVDGAPITVVTQDCYYKDGTPTTTAANAVSTVTFKYGTDQAVTDALKTATPAELIAIPAFGKTSTSLGWTLDKNDANVAMPIIVSETKYGHTYTDEVIPATCKDKGYTIHTCECGHSYQDNYVNELPHAESADWIVDKEATVDFAGMRHKVCTACGITTTTEILPKLPAEGNGNTAEDTKDANDTTATTDATNDTAKTNNDGDDTAKADASVGCGGSIALGGMVLMTTVISLGAATVSKKRK